MIKELKEIFDNLKERNFDKIDKNFVKEKKIDFIYKQRFMEKDSEIPKHAYYNFDYKIENLNFLENISENNIKNIIFESERCFIRIDFKEKTIMLYLEKNDFIFVGIDSDLAKTIGITIGKRYSIEKVNEMFEKKNILKILTMI